MKKDKLIIAKIIILLSFLIDAMIPYYTGCDDINLPCNDESVTQIVFLLPYTALLRPIWPMLRFSAIRITLIASFTNGCSSSPGLPREPDKS